MKDKEGCFKMKIWLALLAVMIFGFICHGAAMDVLVEGTAVNDFQRIGASGWIVEVILSGGRVEAFGPNLRPS